MTELFQGSELLADIPYDPLEEQIIIKFAHDVSDAVHGVNEYHDYLQQGMTPFEAFCGVASSYGRSPDLPTGYALQNGEIVRMTE